MSTAYAYARPQRPGAPAAPETTRIEIVTTRAQRRARPKSFYATVAVVTVFAILLVQLALSLVLSDGAYQISALQTEQRQLSRTQQDLGEKLELLGSQQSLAAKAEALGMVIGTSSPAFLRLSDGALIGTPSPAVGSSGALADSGGLVPNALLTPSSEAGSSPTTDGGTGAPSSTGASNSVASPSGDLPAPNTR